MPYKSTPFHALLEFAGAIQDINRGVVFFRPNRNEARAVLLESKTYSFLDFFGDEQELLM